MKNRYAGIQLGFLVAVAGGASSGLASAFDNAETDRGTSENGVLGAGNADVNSTWDDPPECLAPYGERVPPSVAGGMPDAARRLPDGGTAVPAGVCFTPAVSYERAPLVARRPSETEQMSVALLLVPGRPSEAFLPHPLAGASEKENGKFSTRTLEGSTSHESNIPICIVLRG